jgi:hypothetical protein
MFLPELEGFITLWPVRVEVAQEMLNSAMTSIAKIIPPFFISSPPFPRLAPGVILDPTE